jgi:hypothetical protein
MSDALTARAAVEWRAERDANERLRAAMPLPAAHQASYVPAYVKGLKILDGVQLLSAQFPPRTLMLSPWLPEKGLAMLYAPRGVGKTWIALGIAHAIAGGSGFLRWRAPSPSRVVYIDGEMPAVALQERYAAVVAASDMDAPGGNFRLLAADMQEDGLPDLADPEAQRFYDRYIADADLIIVDNLSTIARSLRENEADSFGPLQAWMVSQRSGGRSVLLVHHAGKGGGQRGTSRKEDTLDTVISLSRPPGYSAGEGARFEVRFTKSRGFWGDDAEPFEARFADQKWVTSEIVSDDSDETLATMHASGLSLRDMEQRTGVPRSTLARRLNGSVR